VVKRPSGRAWLLLAAVACAAGCAQALGLGDYGKQSTDGADLGGADATASAEGGSEAGTRDAGSPADSGSADGRAPGADGSTDAGSPRDTGGAGDAALVFSPDACAGSNTCAQAPPAGWQGPLALWEGPGSAPPCGAWYVPLFDGGTSLAAPAAQCGCQCGAPAGVTCGSVTAQFGTGGCSASCGTATLAPGPCTSVQTYTTGCGSGAGMTLSGSTASGGSCQPSPSVTFSPPSWGTRAVACAPTAQSPLGCPAGEQCVPAAAAPFESRFCVLKAGTSACPPGAYSAQRLYYGDVTDTRGCSACSCGAPAGVDCNAGAHVATWGNPSCNANPGADLTPLPQACGSATGIKSVQLTATPDGGSCAPDGGLPTGVVAPQALTTICCTP
jgi:hypothetical protein